MSTFTLLPLDAVVTILAASFGATGLQAATPETETVSLDVYPRSARAGSGLRALIRFEPHERARRLLLMFDSGKYYSACEVPLEGDRAAGVHELAFGSLPAGDYVIEAVVSGADGVIAKTASTFARQRSNR